MTEDDFEPARRELCPDGTCVGLIGPDGRCKVCGAVGTSTVVDPRHRGMRSPLDGDESRAPSDGDELDDERELCPDGTCVGVIGVDGRCKVCGARGAGPARAGSAGSTPGLGAQAESGAVSNSGAEADEDEDRELCPDGGCIGLIGPDRRCKVCGTAADSPTP
jgi:hypothetical protein